MIRYSLRVALIAVLLCASSVFAADPIRPDPTLTPGVTNPAVTQATACSTRWGKDHRAVTEAMKRHVALSYGITRASIVGAGKGPCCEFDHLIPRELGGADDERNLWPQRWVGKMNAHDKDRAENYFHREVCAGRMTLASAQKAIRTDWVAAYRKAGLKP